MSCRDGGRVSIRIVSRGHFNYLLMFGIIFVKKSKLYIKGILVKLFSQVISKYFFS